MVPSSSLRLVSSCRQRCAPWTGGGTLAVAGIWLSDVPALGYDETLFQERSVCNVTANTRADGEEFLELAERFAIHPEVTTYPISEAACALADLPHGRFSGAGFCAGTETESRAQGPCQPGRSGGNLVAWARQHQYAAPLRSSLERPTPPRS